ncbi:putative late blight resistance protein homolog R1B-16 [Salvia miltiorrhiza]|uniref:putative late blight resistance protein homolog R1B-16 n=1 Tax=Salvia miltiorrhiza TaxID=226208 RepID=UPI0025AC47E8|nr:putative late blight resistance protein homolog R1B-16 [Salvia miltiorrhiza]XP_057763727.1 putative late blight resistance protein homolog R1B-16 [Salvia miltiorrhiza]
MAAAYATLVSALNIINNLHHHPRPPISLSIQQVESLTQKIHFLLEFVEGYNPHRGYSKEADPLESRIADAAYATEHAIESHILDQFTNNRENMSYDGLYEALEKVIEDMAYIEEEAKQVQGRVGVVQHQLLPDSSTSSEIPQQSIMVGADDVKRQMMDKLISGDGLQIIPIVGMGGSGKTTLARNIYEERLIKKHFYICAWATISQEYTIREIFGALLRQLNIAVDDNLTEQEFGEILYRYLYHRRYLIIMDDMWSIDAWDRVRNYFPNNKKIGSRIVVTTRLSDLASKLPNSDSLGMELLDEAVSWELLSKTVFGEKGCPLELEEIGKKIGKSCKGLPLSIVVVGGLLAKSKHEREFWEEIGENLNATVNLEDDEHCLKILYMSYKQLPIHLKPCFLYMSVFPEDEEISMSELIRYWVAEGFVKAVSGKSLEEIAKEYLKDLIGRNLVLRSTRDWGKKWYQIHDLLRDLCLREAEKERFYNSASDNAVISVLPPMSQARCLRWNVGRKLSPPDMSLLRIVKTTRFQWNLVGHMHQLVNSRLLQIGSYGTRDGNFPCSIWRFWNLQTLIVYTHNEVTAPTDFWYMPHIRHVKFDFGLRLPDPPNDQDDIVLGNLQSLGRVSDFKCSEQVVQKIPNIKELVFMNGGKYSDDEMYCLSNLDFLTKLESLICNSSGKCVINFPHSLKRLNLCSKDYCWEDILDKVGVLPHLQKLTLDHGRFNKRKWETTEGQFRSLKFFTLTYCRNLEIWKIESSHFPCLERLHLIGVMKLREIPLEFAEIPTLREITVSNCSDSVVVSAKRISEEHEGYYGEGALRVRVRLGKWNRYRAGLEGLDSPNPMFVIEGYY